MLMKFRLEKPLLWGAGAMAFPARTGLRHNHAAAGCAAVQHKYAHAKAQQQRQQQQQEQEVGVKDELQATDDVPCVGQHSTTSKQQVIAVHGSLAASCQTSATLHTL
jgi:hypothetical protein